MPKHHDITQFAPTETFLNDTLLQNIDPKRAMIIVAHDDDICGMAGTISKLHKDGWEIAVVSFSKSPERNAAQILACRNILDTVMFVNLTPEQYRNDLKSTKNPYDPIPKNRLNDVFNKEVIEREYIKHINEFKPTVIFSLDNEMGGYGHPNTFSSVRWSLI
ncbi:MAG: PIG-L family deacetylase [Saprospiraceae bacterium]|nr:PIG-L family deacetylase [Candidatus Vicinibacter affinis]